MKTKGKKALSALLTGALLFGVFTFALLSASADISTPTINAQPPIFSTLRLQTTFTQVSAGGHHTAAIAGDGRIWTWGENSEGQLGDSTNTNKNTPRQIPIKTKFTQVAAGYSHTVAIDSDGRLWAWGRNYCGQLGDGTNADKTEPTQIIPGVKFTQVSAGFEHTVAIDIDGSLWAWGRNDYGELGDGTNTWRNEPTRIIPGVKFTQVSAGDAHTAAITTENGLWTWGLNNNGQVGDGTTKDRTEPKRIMPDVKFIQVSAGAYHTVAIDVDDSLWTWGANSEGQLGDGTNTGRIDPKRITDVGKIKFTQVAAGAFHTTAIDSYGCVWTWGGNAYGQLGNDTYANVYTPQQIQTNKTRFKQISASFHTMAIDNDGRLWAWGNNEYGQLGDGTDVNKNVPVKINIPIFTLSPISIPISQISLSVVFSADAADLELDDLQSITLGGHALRENVDFEISGGELTLKAEYMETLLPGTHTFTLEFGEGLNAMIDITIAETEEEADPTEATEATEEEPEEEEEPEPTTEETTEEEEVTPIPPRPFLFTDVPEREWYYEDVKLAYESGLINGKSDTSFAPDDNLTYAEAVKLAACMHQLYTTGKVTLAPGAGEWYDAYVDYAKTNNIIAKDYAWNTPATRAGYMEIFASALPDDALAAINTIPGGSIPDVAMTHAQAAAIYKLYRAGVVQGVDTVTRACNPGSNIKRSEVAAILTRMMNPDKRVKFEMV